MSKKFYITTPLYYVNDVPHIGHAYTTLAADILARYHRLLGEEVFFLTGTDEHGQKVAQSAEKKGAPPQQQADQMVIQFQQLWKRLNVSHNDFIRTTEPRHTQVVQAVLQQLWDRKEIYAAAYEGWYCLPDERFWTEKELIENKCPDCGRPVESIAEQNYFFKMGLYQDRLRQYIKDHAQFIQPEGRRNEVLGFLEKPLGDLCISRPISRLTWGIPLPFDKNYVTYVWFDALVNYISVPGYSTDSGRFKNVWPAQLHLVGKDILTTHAVYWSTMLMALGLELPQQLFAHGWWTMDGEKMSKSRGNVVDPNQVVETFGVDAFRYFLFKEVPFGQDGNFSHAAMMQCYNSFLANDLGNLVSRVVSLVNKFTEGKIPKPGERGEKEQEVEAIARDMHERVDEAMRSLQFHRALGEIWKLVDRANLYIEQMSPWKLAKKGTASEDTEKLRTVLWTAANTIRLIALYLLPFMPETAYKIRKTLGLPDPEEMDIERAWAFSFAGCAVVINTALFPRMEEVKSASVPQEAVPVFTEPPVLDISTPLITIDAFKKLDLRIGEVLSAEPIKGSKKLLKLRVNAGAEFRQIVAGIGTKYRPEELVGKQIVFIANLQPTQLMGIESQGMLLAAGAEKVLGLLTCDERIPPGSRIR